MHVRSSPGEGQGARRRLIFFQDFSKFDLPVRTNVGFGNTDEMDDDALIRQALERGGALDIVESIGGLDRFLLTQESRHPTVSRRKGKKKQVGDVHDSGTDTNTPGDARSSHGLAAAEDEGGVNGDVEGSTGAPARAEEGEQGEGGEEVASDSRSPRDGLSPARLSGGQWQRIALARAFMRVGDSLDLVVFDEPSSALGEYTVL